MLCNGNPWVTHGATCFFGGADPKKQGVTFVPCKARHQEEPGNHWFGAHLDLEMPWTVALRDASRKYVDDRLNIRCFVDRFLGEKVPGHPKTVYHFAT